MLKPLLRFLAILMVCAAAQAAPHLLQVEIDMRAEIAAGRFDPQRGDQVGMRGAQAPLSWDRTSLAQAQGDGRYQLRLRFEQAPAGGQPLPYKFKIERQGASPDEGWEQGRNHALLLTEPSQRLARVFNTRSEDAPPLSRVGSIETHPALPSRHVGPRELQVWLPPGYADREPQRRYPVLYLHDGQNVFDAAAAGAEWQVDEQAQRLVESGTIEPFIVVAVASGPDRLQDYTPTRTQSADGRVAGGGAPAYARYLIEELKPWIDARYRTKSGPASTAVGGSSLGGLVSLWLALHHRETFGAALVVSPSLWWDEMFALRDLQNLDLPADGQRPRLWLDMGGREGGQALTMVRRLRERLLQRGWRDGSTLAYLEVPEAGHDEAAWAARVAPMLRFLYASR
jgi:predicted alpha/beta superfamily hydrolase